jgi:hypothetical protein
MIATFVNFALPVLFFGSGLFALATLALTWRAYGRELGALRAQLASADEWREFDVRLARTQVREFSVPVRRNVPRGRGPVAGVMAVPRQVAGRRAAA